MRILFILLLLTFSMLTFGQVSQLEKIENEIKKKVFDGNLEKQFVDLNGDTKDDIIYFYQCGESKCIMVLLNIDDAYKERIQEHYSTFTITNSRSKKALHLSLYQCCGESPYISNRTFEFNQTSIALKENYVLTNGNYTEQIELLTPIDYSPNPFYAKVVSDNYELRFSPSLKKLEGKAKETFTYACDEETNIIAKIKIASKIKVLSELKLKDGKWLFVEIESNMIAGKCNPISFDFKDQKLRGWVSDTHLERN